MLRGEFHKSLPLLLTGQQLSVLRSAIQTYDSNGNFVINEYDAYIDLYDLAHTLVMSNTLDDPTVVVAAQQLLTNLDHFVLHRADWHASGSFFNAGHSFQIDLDRSGGIGIYYPYSSENNSGSTYQQYINHQLFHITENWGWATFVGQIQPATAAAPTLTPWFLPIVRH